MESASDVRILQPAAEHREAGLDGSTVDATGHRYPLGRVVLQSALKSIGHPF